jgi:hypothetical protein
MPFPCKIAESLAAVWDGVAVDADTASLVDAHIQPRLEALVDVADSDDSGAVDAAVTAAWRAYSETRSASH